MNDLIMIVEDDEVIARAVQQSLVSWGMDAFCVQDFSGVLAEFAVKNPQLVLMDIHLPFFNGFHWCQEIRKVSKVPVIFLSSASDNMNIIMAVNMGGDDFIAKPFDVHGQGVVIYKISGNIPDFFQQAAAGKHFSLVI